MIYVDFDDVLCETARDLTRLLKEMFGRSVEYDGIRTFDLGVSFDLGPEDLARFMEAAHKPDNLARIAPTEGAREVLEAWNAAGLEVCVVTGRPPSSREASQAWLERHAIPCSRLIFVDKYHRAAPASGAMTLDELAEMEFIFAVDDAPAMLDVLAARMSMPIVVFDRPWNQGSPAAPARGRRVLRCGSWEEIIRVTAPLIAGVRP